MKGGYAGVNNRLSVSDTVPNRSTGSGSPTQWHNGWTVGAGWEYGITANWIVGLEYDYSAFETKSYQLAGAGARQPTPSMPSPTTSSRPWSAELQVRRPGRRAVLRSIFCLSMIFSENRYPLFRIMLWFLHDEQKPRDAGAFLRLRVRHDGAYPWIE